MPRPPRVHVPGLLYHVTVRGNHRQVIFSSGAHYRKFLRLLPEHLTRHCVTLYAYCLMPNHLHLLVRVGTVPLGNFMQTLLLGYSKWWNAVHRQTGHLFQSRYHQVMCDRDEYLMELVRYIHLNPLRARLTQHFEGWAWSSLSAYVDREVSWIKTAWILEHWGPDLTEAVHQFKKFLMDGLAMPVPPWNIHEGRYVWPDTPPPFKGTCNP